MDRIVQRHQVGESVVDVIEVVDDNETYLRFMVDGDVLPPELHPSQIPDADGIARLVQHWHDLRRRSPG